MRGSYATLCLNAYGSHLTQPSHPESSIDPPTGKFKSHIDYWDAIENQKFLSFEAVRRRPYHLPDGALGRVCMRILGRPLCMC